MESRLYRAGRLILAAGTFVLGTETGTQARQVDTLALRAHTYFLAQDVLAGRAAGSAGEHIAALYIREQLARLGLQPAFGDRYRQTVPLRSIRATAATRLQLQGPGGSATFVHGRDFVVGTGSPRAFRDFAGPAVLLGAAAAPATDDVTGRVIVVPGTLGMEALDAVLRWHAAGVAGIVQLVPDSAQYALLARSRGEERLTLEQDVADPIWQSPLPSIFAGPAVTEAILRGVRLPDAVLLGEHAAPISLGREIRFTFHGDERRLESVNVAGVVRGSDPVLRDEYVVYTAHLDHLGTGPPEAPGADSIYNGFSDNAAGVAMLLAIARTLRDAPPPRSVLFLFTGAEERGLLGASSAAANPPIPLDRIAALINLDAGAPAAPPIAWRIAGGEGSELGRLADDVARANGWSTVLGPASPNSDYWPFLRRGVPSIFLIPGSDWEGVTADERDALRRRWDRYHRLDDEWDAEFPFTGLARYAELALGIGRAAAGAGHEMPTR